MDMDDCGDKQFACPACLSDAKWTIAVVGMNDVAVLA